MSLQPDEPINTDIEEQLKILTDEKHISAARKKAEQEYGNLTTEQWNGLRAKCKSDLFFLTYGILGYTRLSPNLHAHLCQWMAATRARQYREILLPRGHFKSTIATIGDSIQTILPDVEGNAIYPRNLGTNCRLLIAHETAESAGRFLFGIAGHFLNNPLLMGLFPECIPTAKIQRINKHELELPRTEIWPEPTIDTMGVGGKSQGKHYNKLKLDDLIGDKARDSTAEMQTAKDWIDNIQAYFSKFSDDQFDLIGTRWARNDLYEHVHEIYGDQLVKYIRPVEEVINGKRIAIFSEEFTPEKLAIIRKNRKIFSSQYLNNPQGAENKFEKSWIRYYSWTNPWNIKVLTGTVERKVDLNTCDRLIFIDPATTGDTGFIITATDRTNKTYVVEATKQVFSPPELVEKVFREVNKWRPRMVIIEEVIFSKVYKPYLEAEMKLRRQQFRVEMVRTRQVEKGLRIEGLTNFFSAAQIYFNEGQTDLIEEYNSFGASDDNHLLDALAYGPQFWRAGTTQQGVIDIHKAAKAIMEKRNIETGYSQIKYGS